MNKIRDKTPFNLIIIVACLLFLFMNIGKENLISIYLLYLLLNDFTIKDIPK
jgi:hypothetical protein